MREFRFTYNLKPESVVFDLGGYKGTWSNEILTTYGCNIYCFEPAAEFAENLKTRFLKNDKVIVYPFGLSDKNKKAMISHNDDGSSIFRGKGQEEIFLVRAIDFMIKNRIEKIDLTKINIEGGEYDLLDHLIETDYIKNMVDIQIQFHNFVQNAKERTKNIQNNLRKTHNLTYQIGTFWENWKLK